MNKKRAVYIIISIVVLLVLIFLSIKICDNMKIKLVISDIDNIGTVEYTSECLDRINKARIGYYELNEKQREKVSNFNIMEEANNTYGSLMKYDELVNICNETINDADAAALVLLDIIHMWNNIETKVQDKYNNGIFYINEAMNSYYKSEEYGQKKKSIEYILSDSFESKIEQVSAYSFDDKNIESARVSISTWLTYIKSMANLKNKGISDYSEFVQEAIRLLGQYKMRHSEIKENIPEIYDIIEIDLSGLNIKKETVSDSASTGEQYSYISSLRKEYNDAQKILADNNSTKAEKESADKKIAEIKQILTDKYGYTTGDINTFLGNLQWETREKVMNDVNELLNQMGASE